MDYVIDVTRRDLVLDAILDRYRRGAYPYNLKSTMLETLSLPKRLKRGGEEEARWWFFCCMLMRGGVDTDVALAALSRMYDSEMRRGGLWPFKPERAAKLTLEQMTGLVKDAGTGLERFVRDWVKAAAILVERHDGKVLPLLQSTEGSYNRAVELLRNQRGSGFPGFQYKMVSMLLFFVTEAQLLEYFPYPPPIDFHLQRVTIETLILQRADGQLCIAYPQREHERVQELLRDSFLDYISERGIRSNELSDALWLLSRMLCKWAPGNRSLKGERNGRSTPVSWGVVDFTTERDHRRYERSCSRCPVETLCERNVGSGFYYVQGKLHARPRERSPVLRLDLGA